MLFHNFKMEMEVNQRLKVRNSKNKIIAHNKVMDVIFKYSKKTKNYTP